MGGAAPRLQSAALLRIGRLIGRAGALGGGGAGGRRGEKVVEKSESGPEGGAW
jgi:hypothetical protein